jgi:hypothetical protein
VIELLAAEWRQRRRYEPQLRVDGYRRRFPHLGDALAARLESQADSGAAEPAKLPPRPGVDSEAPTLPPSDPEATRYTPRPPEPSAAAPMNWPSRPRLRNRGRIGPWWHGRRL